MKLLTGENSFNEMKCESSCKTAFSSSGQDVLVIVKFITRVIRVQVTREYFLALSLTFPAKVNRDIFERARKFRRIRSQSRQLVLCGRGLSYFLKSKASQNETKAV